MQDEFHRVQKMQESTEQEKQKALESQKVVDELGKRFLNDTNKWVSQKLRPDNFATSRDRLAKVIDFCRNKNYDVSTAEERRLVADLREKYEDVVRKDIAKQEQRRIKEQIREEQKAERELKKKIAEEEAQAKAIAKALDAALAVAKDSHSEEVERLRAQLEEAEARTVRTKSMAELTKAGNVYVISNIGSFGEGVYKIGMTRRLEPMDRVRELGDASVPFPFDVHMMIACDDAPKLEASLHRSFHHRRVNRVNFRKEYFRVSFDEILAAVESEHGEVAYVADPEAFEYLESVSTSDQEMDSNYNLGIATGVLEEDD